MCVLVGGGSGGGGGCSVTSKIVISNLRPDKYKVVPRQHSAEQYKLCITDCSLVSYLVPDSAGETFRSCEGWKYFK